MEKIKDIRKILTLLVIVVLIFFGYRTFSSMKLDNKIEILSNKIEENIVSLSELTAVKYNYTNIVEYKDSLNLSGFNLPFTTKTFLVKYDGYIKAGTDFAAIKTEVKDLESVIVKIPNPVILENVIAEEDVYFYNEKDSVFNSLKFDDLYSILKAEKSKMESEVVEKGILNDAKTNIEASIKAFMSTIGFNDIKIEFI